MVRRLFVFCKPQVPAHALHEKGFTKPTGRRSTGQQPRNEELVSSGGITAYQPLVHRGFCSSVGLHMVPLVRASEGSSRTIVFDALEGARVGVPLGGPIRRRPVLPRPAPPRPAAPPCAAPPRPARGIFPDMPCMNRVYSDNKRRYTGQQPGTKSASRPADKPRMNRG